MTDDKQSIKINTVSLSSKSLRDNVEVSISSHDTPTTQLFNMAKEQYNKMKRKD